MADFTQLSVAKRSPLSPTRVSQARRHAVAQGYWSGISPRSSLTVSVFSGCARRRGLA